MQTREDVRELTTDYLKRFPGEKAEVQPLIDFINRFESEAMTSRKNFTGHITTSAFILDHEASALLLLKHKFLDRWLQPGGHVDTTDASLSAAAIREAVEETGLAAKHLQLLSPDPFDIDSHNIPANIKKQEPAHVHHDIRFLFQCILPQELAISFDESTDGRWFPFEDLTGNSDFSWVAEKISSFM
jgi:8-oxo-dGTP pyrophosphatase MutT (NUDIX family)